MKKILTILLVFFSLSSYAQQVSGIVMGDKEPLEGASVYEKDLPQNGSTTDKAGRFVLTLKGKSGVIIISSVSYLTREVKANGTNLTIKLTIDSKGTDEVIVVGYGKQRRITNTGAVSSISGADLRQTPTASVQNALMGRVPGVTTQQTSGKPGADGASIRIRGVNTYVSGGGNPLYIVDDVEFPGLLSEIDPDQIESISVLKDAATTSIYGVKGANGVILITTRRGKSGKPTITIRNETGAQVASKLPKYVNSYEAARLTNLALTNDGMTPRFTDTDLQLFKDGTDPYNHPNVDWLKTILRPYTLQNRTNLNIQGGNDKVKYFIAGGYLWQNGTVRSFKSSENLNNNFYYKRYNFRTNLDAQLTKTLSLNVDLSGNLSEQNQPHSEGKNGTGTNNIFLELRDYKTLPPFAYPVYNPDGSYGYSPQLVTNNIVGRLTWGGYERTNTNDMLVNVKLTQKLDFVTKGLSIKGIVGYNTRYSYGRNLTRAVFPSYYYNADKETYTPVNIGGANISRPEKLNMTYIPTNVSYRRLNTQIALAYDRDFGKHHVYGLGLLNQYQNIAGANVPLTFRGITFRAGYDFKKKYLVELNGAYNGSSKFAKGSQYGFFPAASVGWNVSEENFFKNSSALHFINLLKLRGSYGLMGSDEFTVSGNYVYQQNYNRGTATYTFGESPTSYTPLVEGAIGTDVTWEKERSGNIGLDMNMFNGKLTFTADYFYRYRYDILTTRQDIPSMLGVNLNAVNIGIVENRGYEIDIRYRNSIGKVNYYINANASFAKNKVLQRSEAQPAYPWLALTGNPVGSIVGYTFTGYYNDSIDIAKSAKPSTTKVQPGDLKYADLNGDGNIDQNDQRVMRYPNMPNTILGTTLGVSWKNISFSATFQGALNFSLQGGSAEVNPFQNNFRQIHLNSWTPENHADPSFPRLTSIEGTVNNALSFNSDYWYTRADYVRLKTLELSYSIGQSLLKKTKVITGARIYVNGYNLATWMLKGDLKYDIDPESNSGTLNDGTYPQQKVYNAGIQLSF
ncbi:SusC/RagA family TonB-linked outer membrane protein [Pinibacter soli]|uniref:TonB-dependent receptor n=1 Tax=Pinibacter soli TaxID=3044211 RepID=A0ABT6R736_9BACT|nr:TonB-dependent receptor [Pinibacter soli]MDI3318379.1 TonB-dependent receptor [Pinibacter soli]